MDRRQRVFACLLGLELAWGSWFIWRTSFEALGTRTFCLFDDAMISMTYARNFVEGFGLNWARFGSPVEGFTHPLWLAIMVLAHLLPIDRLQVSLIVQSLSLALLLVNVAVVRKLLEVHFVPSPEHGLSRWLPAAALTASYYPLNHWALQGMESALQALLVLLAVYLTLEVARMGGGSQARGMFLRLGGVLGLAYLLRMDLLLLAIGCLGFLAWHHRGLDHRCWVRLVLPLAIAIVGYQIFRWSYFGEPLPNTYYLKLEGYPLEIRLLRGLWSFSTFFFRPAALGLLTILVTALPVLRVERSARLLVAVFGLFGGYSIYVGGDVWEAAGIGANRFICFAVPLLFVLGNRALGYWREHGSPPLRRLLTHPSAVLALTLAGFASFNGLLVAQPDAAWSRLLLLDPPLHVPEHRRFTRLVLGLEQSELVDPDARVAVVWAGLTAYFTRWEMVDLMGYNERWIARQPVIEALSSDTYRNYLPGHLKAAHQYVLDTYRPDLVLQFWGLPEERERELLQQSGYTRRARFWLREDSAKVRIRRFNLTPGELEALGAREPTS